MIHVPSIQKCEYEISKQTLDVFEKRVLFSPQTDFHRALYSDRLNHRGTGVVVAAVKYVPVYL